LIADENRELENDVSISNLNISENIGLDIRLVESNFPIQEADINILSPENILSNENMSMNISHATSNNTTISSFTELSEINILDIENHNIEMSMESEISVSNDSFGGRRIVDINYIFSQIQILNSKIHTPGLGCSFMNFELVNEIKKGFET
ncbi:CCHC-type domain-containing protein, partial [Aphis craccivora]